MGGTGENMTAWTSAWECLFWCVIVYLTNNE